MSAAIRMPHGPLRQGRLDARIPTSHPYLLRAAYSPPEWECTYDLLQVPDVSAVIQASDFPCVKAAGDTPDTDFRADWQQLPPEHFDGRPIPVFGYNRRDGFMDLLFPDFTYFGHEYSQITGAAFKMCSGVRISQEARLHLRRIHARAYAAPRLLPVHLRRFLLPPPEAPPLPEAGGKGAADAC